MNMLFIALNVYTFSFLSLSPSCFRQHGMVFPTHDKCMDSARVISLREEGLLLRNRTLMVDENNKLSPSNKGFSDSRDDYDVSGTSTASAIGSTTTRGGGSISAKTENGANVANPLTPPSSSSSQSTLHKNTPTNTHHVSTTHTDTHHTNNKQHTNSIHHANTNATHHSDNSNIQYTDSMTKCLTCMEQYTTTLRHIYDREMTFRLQKQNQIIINHTSYYNDYIILLLTCLSESYVAERSSFNCNFVKIFEDVIVTTIQSAHHSRFLSAYKSTNNNSNTTANSANTTPIKTSSVNESNINKNNNTTSDVVSRAIPSATSSPPPPPPPPPNPTPPPSSSPTSTPVGVLKRRSSWKQVDHVIPIPRVPSDLALNETSNTTTTASATTSAATSVATSNHVPSGQATVAAATVIRTGNPDLSVLKQAPPSFLQSNLSTLFLSPTSWLSPLTAAVAPTTTTVAPTVSTAMSSTAATHPPPLKESTSNNTAPNTNTTTVNKSPSRRSSKTSTVVPPLPSRDLIKPKNIILYTCSILVSKLSIPAQFYLTSQYIFIMSGIHIPGIPLGLSCHRECYSLYDIVNITQNNTNNNSINIVLYEYDKCILYITSTSTNLLLEWLTRVRRRLDTTD